MIKKRLRIALKIAGCISNQGRVLIIQSTILLPPRNLPYTLQIIILISSINILLLPSIVKVVVLGNDLVVDNVVLDCGCGVDAGALEPYSLVLHLHIFVGFGQQVVLLYSPKLILLFKLFQFVLFLPKLLLLPLSLHLEQIVERFQVEEVFVEAGVGAGAELVLGYLITLE